MAMSLKNFMNFGEYENGLIWRCYCLMNDNKKNAMLFNTSGSFRLGGLDYKTMTTLRAFINCELNLMIALRTDDLAHKVSTQNGHYFE